MQKHEGNQATIYYLDMLGYIIVGIPLLLLLPASGIIQHPAGGWCQAAVQCGVVELVARVHGRHVVKVTLPCAGLLPPCVAWRQQQPRYRNNAYSRSWSCSAPGLGPASILPPYLLHLYRHRTLPCTYDTLWPLYPLYLVSMLAYLLLDIYTSQQHSLSLDSR